MRVIGLAGWSGAGKTTLIVGVNPRFARTRARCLDAQARASCVRCRSTGRGIPTSIARPARACEVLVASSRRFALMHELRGAEEPDLADLLRRMSPADLILVKGYKRDAHAKIEVHREANAKPFLYPEDPTIAALATDARESLPANIPHAHLDDITAIASLVLSLARPIEETVSRLRRRNGAPCNASRSPCIDYRLNKLP